jgi:hypothetical protein
MNRLGYVDNSEQVISIRLRSGQGRPGSDRYAAGGGVAGKREADRSEHFVGARLTNTRLISASAVDDSPESLAASICWLIIR